MKKYWVTLGRGVIHLTFERGAADFETICFYSKFLKVEKKKRDPEFSRLSRCLFISLSFLSLSLARHFVFRGFARRAQF